MSNKPVTITFTVDTETGEFDMKIAGIQGEGCKPFHAKAATDLAAIGIGELTVEATAEMNAGAAAPNRVAPVRVVTNPS